MNVILKMNNEVESERISMMHGAFIIPATVVQSFSATTRAEILSYMGMAAQVAEAAPPQFVPEDGPPDITVAMARKLIAEPINEKSLAVLRVIAESGSGEFYLADAVTAAPGATSHGDLRGAWSGITRRARKILDDSSLDLIWWDKEGIRDAAGTYVDHVGRISPLTHRSLRAALGIRVLGED